MNQLGADLAVPVPGVDPAWDGAGVLPLSRLSAQDFDAPGHYLAAPFPGPDTGERVKVRDMLKSLRQRAEETGLLGNRAPKLAPEAPPDTEPGPVAKAPEPEATPPLTRGVPWFTPPVGPLGTRLRAFIDWLRRQVTCSEVWIVDAQGSPITDIAAATPELGGAAALLADAARRALKHIPGAGEGSVQLDLPADLKLSVIDTGTASGNFCLCLVLGEPLPARSADRLRRALRHTIENETPAPPSSSPSGRTPAGRTERW